MKESIKELKLKLQFTGWLQYIPLIFLAIILALLALLFSIFNFNTVSLILFSISGILVLNGIFEILTIKYKFWPKEKIPDGNKNLDDFELMKSRFSCRSFQKRNLTDNHKNLLLNYVKDVNSKNDKIGSNQIRFEYLGKPVNVWPVVGAHEFLIAIAPKEYSRETIMDVGRNLQKVVNFAAKKGISTCWIGPGADQTSIIKYLGEKFNSDDDHIIVVCAIGYKSKLKPLFVRLIQYLQKRRLPLESLFFKDEKMEVSADINSYPLNKYKRNFEVCRWAPSAFNSQPIRCVAKVNENKVESFDFYTVINSKYYAPVALGIWLANWETGCKALGIKGEFKILENKSKNLPLYNVSWIPED